MAKIEQRLAELGIVLPDAAAPAANYVPFVLSGNQLFISGQVPFENGKIKYQGQIGSGATVEDAIASARQCGLNIIAQAKAALGDLDRVERVIKLGGFVNAPADFNDHPKVINGASDLIVEVFGEAGRHSRFAVGATGLPLGSTTEIEAIMAVRP